MRLNLRRCTSALRPSSLEFHILRSRNPAEETRGEDGKYIKGEKNWFRLVLFETTEKKGVVDVQILAEGDMKTVKAEILDGFEEAIGKKVEVWKEREKERDRMLRKEALAVKSANKKKKNEAKGEGKATKKKQGKGKAKVWDESEEEELDLDMLDDTASSSEDEMAQPPQFASSQRKIKRKARTGVFDGLEEEDVHDEWAMDPYDEFDTMAYKAKKREGKGETRKSVSRKRAKSKDAQVTVMKVGRRGPQPQLEGDEYGYDSESGGFEGIRVKNSRKTERVRFQDIEENNA